jgi:predicted metal-dependent peptidase
MVTTEAQMKITKAKVTIGLSHPFFAVVGFGLDYIEVDDTTAPWCKTMATDGQRVWWNRNFVDQLTVSEVTGVIVHEVMHVVWLHMTRRGERDPKIWNIAGDYAINRVARSKASSSASWTRSTGTGRSIASTTT